MMTALGFDRLFSFGRSDGSLFDGAGLLRLCAVIAAWLALVCFVAVAG